MCKFLEGSSISVLLLLCVPMYLVCVCVTMGAPRKHLGGIRGAPPHAQLLSPSPVCDLCTWPVCVFTLDGPRYTWPQASLHFVCLYGSCGLPGWHQW